MKIRAPKSVEYIPDRNISLEQIDLVFNFLFEKVFARLQTEYKQSILLSNSDK